MKCVRMCIYEFVIPGLLISFLLSECKGRNIVVDKLRHRYIAQDELYFTVEKLPSIVGNKNI